MTTLKEKQLIKTIYHYYYGEDPKFIQENREDLTLKIQSMFYLLQYFGHYFSNFSFSYNTLKDYRMPISMDIQDNIVLMINNSDEVDLVQLKKEALIEINIISKLVIEKIKNEDSMNNWLRLIPSIIYTKEFMLPTAKNDKIAFFNNCSIKDVEEIDKLCMEIDKAIIDKIAFFNNCSIKDVEEIDKLCMEIELAIKQIEDNEYEKLSSEEKAKTLSECEEARDFNGINPAIRSAIKEINKENYKARKNSINQNPEIFINIYYEEELDAVIVRIMYDSLSVTNQFCPILLDKSKVEDWINNTIEYVSKIRKLNKEDLLNKTCQINFENEKEYNLNTNEICDEIYNCIHKLSIEMSKSNLDRYKEIIEEDYTSPQLTQQPVGEIKHYYLQGEFEQKSDEVLSRELPKEEKGPVLKKVKRDNK